jgi:hypothetical protein
MVSSNGIVRKIRLGDDISTQCGRCKEERDHQVVALSSPGLPERVICKTCGSDHKYRAAKSASTRSSASRPARESTRRKLEDDVPFNGAALSYSPKDVYAQGTFISHPKFGTGKVVEARSGKIDVKFGSDLRTLLHAG